MNNPYLGILITTQPLADNLRMVYKYFADYGFATDTWFSLSNLASVDVADRLENLGILEYDPEYSEWRLTVFGQTCASTPIGKHGILIKIPLGD